MDIEQVVQESRASQQKDELRFLLQTVGTIEPKVILEIGSWRGYSLEVWKKAFNPDVLIGIEKDLNNFDRDLIHDYFVIFDDSASPGTANFVAKTLNGKKIDFLFIDGDHTYEGVKKDWWLYRLLVRSGGFIVFHDIALSGVDWIQSGVEVSRLWEEIKISGYKTLEFQGDNGTGVGIVCYDKAR